MPTDEPSSPSLRIELSDDKVSLVMNHPTVECKAIMSPDYAIEIGNRLIAVGRAAGGKSKPVMRGKPMPHSDLEPPELPAAHLWRCPKCEWYGSDDQTVVDARVGRRNLCPQCLALNITSVLERIPLAEMPPT